MSVKTTCRLCSRLVEYRKQIKKSYPDYYCKPVPQYGQKEASLLIVGLAPGLHGANKTGIPFTGDKSGALLFETLHRLDLADNPLSSTDGETIELRNCRITNAVKCLPPQNRPTASEINNCGQFLKQDIDDLRPGGVIVALGTVAHQAVLKALGLSKAKLPFSHGRVHQLPGEISLVDSYHCSRYNIQTRRLTPDMLFTALEKAKKLITQ